MAKVFKSKQHFHALARRSSLQRFFTIGGIGVRPTA
jgi:hypothetical protein